MRIRSVTIEAIGDDEKSVDLWVEYTNGLRQAQQCKARNGSNEFWPIRDLKARGILDSIRFQLDRNSGYEFVLVSGVPAKLFGDICDSARNSNDNAEDFYQYQIQGVGIERHSAFQQICIAWNLNFEDEKDRAIAFDYLRRIRIELYPDDSNTWGELLTRAGFLLSGEPNIVIATLLTYAESHDQLGIPIYADELRKFLFSQNIHPKNLVYDNRIAPTIERLQSDSTFPLKKQG